MADFTLYGVRAFSSILAIGLHVIAYMYLKKLEDIKCKCAADQHTPFMKNALLLIIGFLFINMFLPIPDINKGTSMLSVVLVAAELAIAAIAVVFYIFVIRYINRLAREKCRCSEDIRREVTYVYAILQLVMLGIFVLMALINGTLLFSKPVGAVMKTKTRVLSEISDPIGSVRRSAKEASRLVKRITTPRK